MIRIPKVRAIMVCLIIPKSVIVWMLCRCIVACNEYVEIKQNTAPDRIPIFQLYEISVKSAGDIVVFCWFGVAMLAIETFALILLWRDTVETLQSRRQGESKEDSAHSG